MKRRITNAKQCKHGRHTFLTGNATFSQLTPKFHSKISYSQETLNPVPIST